MKRPRILRACLKGFFLGSVLINIMFISVAAYFRYQIDHPGMQIDKRRRLVFDPGFTIPSRSLDGEWQNGMFHFTRVDTYKTWDWKPKPTQPKTASTP